MNIINLSTDAILHLAEAATRADAEGRRLRVCVEGHAFKYKVGEGMWSPPFYSQPDPYQG